MPASSPRPTIITKSGKAKNAPIGDFFLCLTLEHNLPHQRLVAQHSVAKGFDRKVASLSNRMELEEIEARHDSNGDERGDVEVQTVVLLEEEGRKLRKEKWVPVWSGSTRFILGEFGWVGISSIRNHEMNSGSV